MPADAASSLFEQLAEKYHARGKFPERDRFLILAADAAWNAGQPDAAESYRRRILEHNPNHLLRPYPSFADALKSSDILAYVQQLRRGYPRERVLELMKELEQEPRDAGKAEEPAKPVPFKLAPDPRKAPDMRSPIPPRPNVPAQLTQSQSLQNEPAKPTRPAAPPTVPAPEATAGAGMGAFLFFVVATVAIATAVYVFVLPLIK